MPLIGITPLHPPPKQRRSGVALAMTTALIPLALAALIGLTWLVPLDLRWGQHRLYAGPMFGARRWERIEEDYSGSVLVPLSGVHFYEERGRQLLTFGGFPSAYEISWR